MIKWLDQLKATRNLYSNLRKHLHSPSLITKLEYMTKLFLQFEEDEYV